MEWPERLGALVQDRWSDVAYREESFAEVAERALREMALHESISIDEVLGWLSRRPNLPPQVNSNFARFQLQVFTNRAFRIELLFWVDGTTEVHDHEFSGAFCVLDGSSVHSEYRFRVDERLSENLLIGDLRLDAIDLLARGDTRQILSGDRFIHSLFHLDRPSVTVVVRTHKDPRTKIQYAYLKPSIAANLFYRDPVLEKRIQCLGMLSELDPVRQERFASDVLSVSDLYGSGVLLARSWERMSAQALERLLDQLQERHGPSAALVSRVLREIPRTQTLRAIRTRAVEPEHRFFLALLLNAPTRAHIFPLIERRHPERKPHAAAASWVAEIAALTDEFAAIVADRRAQLVLEGLLSDLPQASIEARLRSERLDASASSPPVSVLAKKIRGSELLQPLFAV